MRRERGFGVNPWATDSRFLISHRLLIDETYASGLHMRLGDFRPRSFLILDKAPSRRPGKQPKVRPSTRKPHAQSASSRPASSTVYSSQRRCITITRTASPR